MQRVACDTVQALAKPPQLARGRLLDLLALGLQPVLQAGGQAGRLRALSGPQPSRFDVGAVSWLHPGARRVVGPAPAVFVVEAVAQRGEGLLPAGRRDVEAAARLQVAAGGEDMHVHPADGVGPRESRTSREKSTRTKKRSG